MYKIGYCFGLIGFPPSKLTATECATAASCLWIGKGSKNGSYFASVDSVGVVLDFGATAGEAPSQV